MVNSKEIELQCRYFKKHCNHEGKRYGLCLLKANSVEAKTTIVDFNECKCPIIIL